MRRNNLAALAMLAALLAACQPSGAPAASASPALPDPSATPVTGAATSSPTALAPTDLPAPLASPPADLFYLVEQGLVIRQSFLTRMSASAPAFPPAVPISPLDVAVTDFAVAPGGEWLLYRANGSVFARSLTSPSEVIVATNAGAPPDVSRGQTMDWSADGSKLAYTDPQGFQIVIGVGGGFSPLVFGVPSPGGAVVDLRYSPDSRWLAAWLDSGQAIVCDTSDPATLRCADLGQSAGLRWLADGWLGIANADSSLSLVDPANPDIRILADPQAPPDEAGASQGWLASPAPDAAAINLADPVTGQTIALATSGRVKSLAWGDPSPLPVSALPMPATLYFLAPHNNVTQVWRLLKTGQEAEPITAASLDVVAYDISADGAKVAYSSGGALFVQTIGQPDALQFAALPPDAPSPTGAPAFSPSGRRIAFANKGLWVYDTVGGGTIRLTPDSPADAPPDQWRVFDQPRYSPDGNWLLAQIVTAQGGDQAVLPSGGNSVSVTALNEIGAQAEWLPDSRLVIYGGSPPIRVALAHRARGGTPLLDALALDVAERSDGRLAFLRPAQSLPFGPQTFRVFSVGLKGEDPQAETGSLVLAGPLLSPDAVLIAGLVNAALRSDGTLGGQLAILNPGTGQVFVIVGLEQAHALKWGK